VRGCRIGGPASSFSGIHPAGSLRAIIAKEKTIMTDPILDEIWRVREELIKQHGGLDGYLAYVRKLDRAHRQRGGRETVKKTRQQSLRAATSKKTPKT
jgi:hypothetical protein